MKLGDELIRIGYKGEEKAGARKFQAMFELHIEQGPILEDTGTMIGVVEGVQGMRWYEVTVTGQDAHTVRRRCICARMRCSAPPA